MATMKVNLLSLGCVKNLVDSEEMRQRLSEAGWLSTDDPAEADLVVVNTCGFIRAAIDESIDTILELARFKDGGSCRRLIVTGCLPQRFGEEIAEALPEVDVFLGTAAFDRIVEAAGEESEIPCCILPDPNLSKFEIRNSKFDSHIGYLKVSEGCDRRCTYCIIPKLRGKQRSRDADDILAQARRMAEAGVREIVLVAQDTTAYGRDLPGSEGLAGLIRRVSDISPDVWVRLLYGHPESIDEATIRAVAERPNICSYFDVPVQHASTRILKKMGRHGSRDDLHRLFDRIRAADPEAVLRTTLITGFPGETDEDFRTLTEFVEDIRFDHLGVFVYSDAEDLPSHRLPDHVPKKIAKERRDRIMSRQTEISEKNNEKYLDKTLEVLTDERLEEHLFAGRTMFQAPEADGITYVHAKEAEIGGFVRVKITDTLEYDLVGEESE